MYNAATKIKNITLILEYATFIEKPNNNVHQTESQTHNSRLSACRDKTSIHARLYIAHSSLFESISENKHDAFQCTSRLIEICHLKP